MRRFAVGLLIVVSALCLLLSSTSLWVRHNVINTGVFVSNVETIVDLPQVRARVTDQVTTTAMAQPQVQDAIDSALTALPPRLQQFRPTVENGIRSLVSTGVAKLLADAPFRPLTQAALTSAHTQLVNGQAVKFTLGQAKQQIPESVQNGLAGQVLALLPDDVGITLLTPADAPRVYNAIDLLKSVWWWLGLVALGTLAAALGLSHRRRKSLRAWSVTTTVLGLGVLVALRVARGQVVAQAKPENRDALGAVYDVLAGSLRSWTLWLIAIALVVLVVTLLWGRIGVVAGIRRGYRSARQKITSRRSARAVALVSAAERTAEGQPAPVVVVEPWYRRLAADISAFFAGLGLDEQAARLGTFVRDRLRPARWTGIVLGAIVLLLWSSPTLSVLIWIGALVALYLGVLEWLQARAPEPAEGTAPEIPTTAPEIPTAANGGPGAPAQSRPVPSQPAPGAAAERSPVPAARTAPDGALAPVLVAPRHAEPDATAVESVPVAPAAPAPTTSEELTTLKGRLDVLDRLGVAHDTGILSDEEFRREKDRVMAL